MDTLNDLLNYKNMKIYQNGSMFSFSLDSVLLASFVKMNPTVQNILDIGCGNAPIPLILSTRTGAHIDGVELQYEVAQLAKKSVAYNCLKHRISIYNQDVKEYAKHMESDQYDVITCNPPFFKIGPNSNFNKESHKTIARHEVALNLDDIFKISKKLLKNNGTIAMVHRPERLIEIIEKMKQYNIEPKRMRLVYPKKNKDANILLIEGTKNGKLGLQILPPLYSHQEDGNYTEDVMAFFRE